MVSRRHWALATAIFAALTAALVIPAWACTLQASISISPTNAAVGETVTVTGDGFYGNGEPVEIRWNSIDGPAAVDPFPTQSTFSVQMTVPEMSDGVHYLVATRSSSTGVRKASQAFVIGEPRSDETDTTSAPGADEGTQQGARSASFSALGSTGNGVPNNSVESGGTSGDPGAGQAASAAEAAVPAAAGANRASNPANANFASSAPGSGSAAGADPQTAAAASVGPAVLDRGASGSSASDLWEGFASGRASLDAGAIPADQGNSAAGIAGATLMLAGSMGLLGFSIVVARRRRPAEVA